MAVPVVTVHTSEVTSVFSVTWLPVSSPPLSAPEIGHSMVVPWPIPTGTVPNAVMVGRPNVTMLVIWLT